MPGLGAVPPRQPRPRAVQRGDRGVRRSRGSWRSRRCSGKNNIPFAFFALTGICTVGLYLAYIIPVYLRCGRATRSRPARGTSAAATGWINILAIIFVVLVVFALDLPFTPTGLPWNDGFDTSVVNYTPLA